VAGCYNEAIHAYVEGSFTREKIEAWDKRLATVFNRGFWDGYYLGQRLGEWSDQYGSRATLQKVHTGKVTNYFDRIGVAEVLIETGKLELGDTIVIIGPTTGAVETNVKELRVNEINCDTADKGERCSLPVEETIRRSDKVYKLVARS
jgi:putative protease